MSRHNSLGVPDLAQSSVAKQAGIANIAMTVVQFNCASLDPRARERFADAQAKAAGIIDDLLSEWTGGKGIEPGPGLETLRG